MIHSLKRNDHCKWTVVLGKQVLGLFLCQVSSLSLDGFHLHSWASAAGATERGAFPGYLLSRGERRLEKIIVLVWTGTVVLRSSRRGSGPQGNSEQAQRLSPPWLHLLTHLQDVIPDTQRWDGKTSDLTLDTETQDSNFLPRNGCGGSSPCDLLHPSCSNKSLFSPWHCGVEPCDGTQVWREAVLYQMGKPTWYKVKNNSFGEHAPLNSVCWTCTTKFTCFFLSISTL